jgi:hypothetical protein
MNLANNVVLVPAVSCSSSFFFQLRFLSVSIYVKDNKPFLIIAYIEVKANYLIWHEYCRNIMSIQVRTMRKQVRDGFNSKCVLRCIAAGTLSLIQVTGMSALRRSTDIIARIKQE